MPGPSAGELDLDDLRMVVAVAEGGSLTAAAARLGVSLNAVSRRLMKLEAGVGVRLVERTTRSLALTEAGERLYRRATSVVQQLDEASAELSDRRGEPMGTVRVVLPSPAVTGDLLRRIDGLLAEHPRLQVQLLVTSRELPLGTDLDLAMVVGELPDRVGIAARKIASVHWWLCAAPSYVARRGAPVVPTDLTRHECLRYRGAAPQERWTLHGPNGQVVVVPVRGSFESDDSRILGDATYAGLGIGIRPPRELGRAIAAGTLVEVLPGWVFEPLPVYLASPAGRGRSPAVRTVASVLTEAIAELL
ncbi:MAG: LysR family transcriptional regulator [Myxococcota bacterium]